MKLSNIVRIKRSSKSVEMELHGLLEPVKISWGRKEKNERKGKGREGKGMMGKEGKERKGKD